MHLNSGDRCNVLSKCCFQTIRGIGDYWYQIEYEYSEGWVFGAQTNLSNNIIQEEKIDCPDCHEVQSGESLYSIAEMHSLTLEELNELNPQLENGWISIGMKLFVVKSSELNEKSEYQDPFYIITTAATKNEELAKEMVLKLSMKGYKSGYLWIPDYKSLSGNDYFSVYIGPFKTAKDCAEFVELYRGKEPGAYGQLVSNDSVRVEIRGLGDVPTDKK